jgi:hypothetical protein
VRPAPQAAIAAPAEGPQPLSTQPASPPPLGSKPGAAPVTAYRAGGYGPNLLTLAPRLLLPVLATDTARESYLAGAEVLGRSALGDIAWSVTGLVDLNTGTPAVEASLDLITPPLAWSLAGGSLQEGWLGASVQLPVFRRLTPLARDLSLGLAGFLYGRGFPGRALQPFLGFGLGWPLDSLDGKLSLWLERAEWGAAENRAQLQADLAIEHFFRFGALRTAVAGFARLDGAEGELAALRGNAAGLAGQYGTAANLDFFIRLLQIRAGTWNPPLFIQDVYVVPFAGAAVTDGGQSQVSAGLELHWELKTLAVWTGLPLDLTVGLAVNGEGAPSLFVNLKSALEGLPLAGAKPGRVP